MKSKIKVMLVDDSAVVRQVLTALLTKDSGIEVIASAPDPIFAMDKMNSNWPDVIVLDVEMPRMDGITFLRQIMSIRPTPVIICSTLTEKGAATSMQALAAGAVAIVTKPKAGLKNFLEIDAGDIVQAVKAAAGANLRPFRNLSAINAAATPPNKIKIDEVMPALNASLTSAMAVTTDKLVAIGTSTGGTQALEVVLKKLSRTAPGIVIVQHMPEKFTEAFADRLNKICEMEVLEAKNGDRLIPGRALVAPGGRHMQVKRSGAQYHVEIIDAPPVNRHRPSVDVLFRSVAKCAGRNALGIIMTGMGDDGALGMKDMHDAGAETIAQDEKSCVVYGMPKEAVKLGAVDKIVPLDTIHQLIEAYGKK
ncbi:chemotaxis response regulator protein-glutamate methylesterase [Undibacterium seohonense]|jgi:two-component system chemotaxis response regulator CheB|uniref:Protein-glutamate methylesterase/protein-glutamine glutaminase n=1 Tax=Undibacterium seohonense TaxID=1344950 RepID=A0ABR6X3C5_9BURK|nr:chemotaxis response regulator protein-glutamate methylesterase [Undibacterium seohonense]MBC3807143.1 chemotaxis response regulator protein-glutamate methylesterase [Undibacterium seohonense]